MLNRIKILENKVEALEAGTKIDDAPILQSKNKLGLNERAKDYIRKCKVEAKKQGVSEITLLCNDIQKELGVVNRTPSICNAMYDMMEADDQVLFAPPSGKSTTVKVKYFIK